MVGSVIVYDGKIIGEGYHHSAGMPHAEVNAIESVKDHRLLGDSTLYVNLEPCSHHGKTPPCADLILEKGIPKVVIGATDTSAKVAGRGIERLRSNGVEVITGVLEEESRWINRRFFTFHEKQRPYIILKWAASADGYIDIIRPPGHPREPWWITGDEERVLVHKWRSQEDAILVGAETIRKDNPSLNVRYWDGKDPVKVIVSGRGELDMASSVFTSGERVILFTNSRGEECDNIDYAGLEPGEHLCKASMFGASCRGISSILIEGGSSIINQFLQAGIWDEARVFAGKKRFGAGVPAPSINANLVERREFEKSTLSLFLPFR